MLNLCHIYVDNNRKARFAFASKWRKNSSDSEGNIVMEWQQLLLLVLQTGIMRRRKS